ncbi:MAG: GerW family sporulation protein [Firmicutes bacterium]|nr:GerW family sporulation protein [Bacillota bacterium]
MILSPPTSPERPVERVMDNAFTKMRSLVDADIVVGTPVQTADGASIIPINRVTMGFLTGGGEYSDLSRTSSTDLYPFAGGSGAGMSVSPVCFLVSDGKTVKLINVDEKNTLDKILGLIPEVAGKLMEDVKGKKK